MKSKTRWVLVCLVLSVLIFAAPTRQQSAYSCVAYETTTSYYSLPITNGETFVPGHLTGQDISYCDGSFSSWGEHAPHVVIDSVACDCGGPDIH